MRLSHSQIDVFNKCKRWWWNQYVEKNIVPSDTRHMRRGSCFHKVAEYILLNNPTIEQTKQNFEEQWAIQKLDDFGEAKDETYLMLLEFFDNKPANWTATESKFYKMDPEFLAYMDLINSNKGEEIIIDYKTSGQVSDDYKEQMGRYAMIFNKHYGVIPKTEVWFVKFHPVKKVLYEFTIDEINAFEQEIRDINIFIEDNKTNKEAFVCCSKEGKGCHYFCPYKDSCNKDDDILQWTLHIFGSYLYLEGPISPLLHKGLEKKFSYTLKNAKWIKKYNPSIIPIVKFWNSSRRLLPIGFIHSVQKTLQDYAEHMGKTAVVGFKDKRVFNDSKIEMPDKFVNGKELRQYQIDAIEQIIPKKIGMLEMGTGSGKTLCFTEIIRRLNFKTLVVVNRIELLKQTRDEIKDLLGIDVGMIGDGEFDMKHITVATIQSLSNNIQQLKDFLRSVRVLIIDEAQYINSKSFWKLARQMVNTEFRISVSGTCRRTDGNDLYLNAVSGDIVYRKSASELINEGYLVEPVVRFVQEYIDDREVKRLEESAKTNLINEEVKYHKLYEAMIMNNAARNDIIARIAEENKDKKIIILTRLIEHGRMLSERFGCPFIYGDSSKEERDSVLTEFKEAKCGVIVGSLEIFSTGINIPSLSVIINAAAQKSDVKSVQSLGRLLRRHSGKSICYLYDFCDSGRLFRNASRYRIKAFIKEGHNIEYITYMLANTNN